MLDATTLPVFGEAVGKRGNKGVGEENEFRVWAFGIGSRDLIQNMRCHFDCWTNIALTASPNMSHLRIS